MKYIILSKAIKVKSHFRESKGKLQRVKEYTKEVPLVPKKVEDDITNEFLSKMSELIGKSRNNNWKYSSIEDFILKNGRKYEYVMPGVKRGKMGECFKNAWHLMGGKGLTYVEGYAISGNLPIPILHAWCVDKNGIVYDPTWQDGKSYFGVPFSTKFVYSTAMKRKRFGIVDDMEQSWPLIRGEVGDKEWKLE